MSLPADTASVLVALGYEPLVDFVCVDTDGTISITEWNSNDAQPTDQQISDWANDTTTLPNNQKFSDWKAEHGGDPAKTLRRLAIEAVDTADPVQRLILRSMAAIIDQKFADVIGLLNPLLDPADRLPANRSIAELETAMKQIIASGAVDD